MCATTVVDECGTAAETTGVAPTSGPSPLAARARIRIPSGQASGDGAACETILIVQRHSSLDLPSASAEVRLRAPANQPGLSRRQNQTPRGVRLSSNAPP